MIFCVDERLRCLAKPSGYKLLSFAYSWPSFSTGFSFFVSSLQLARLARSLVATRSLGRAARQTDTRFLLLSSSLLGFSLALAASTPPLLSSAFCQPRPACLPHSSLAACLLCCSCNRSAASHLFYSPPFAFIMPVQPPSSCLADKVGGGRALAERILCRRINVLNCEALCILTLC